MRKERNDKPVIKPEQIDKHVGLAGSVRIACRGRSGRLGLRSFLRDQGFTVQPDNYTREERPPRKGKKS